jgi:hypothetical protein
VHTGGFARRNHLLQGHVVGKTQPSSPPGTEISKTVSQSRAPDTALITQDNPRVQLHVIP